VLEPFGEQTEAGAIPINDLEKIGPGAAPEHEQVACKRLCGAPHNRFYVSADVMWRRRPKAMRGRATPCSPAT
jgi:hypothetical protein